MVVGDVEIPDFTKVPVWMSGVVLASDLLATQRTMKEDTTLEAVLGGMPTAERTFSRRDVVTAYAEVYTRAGVSRPVVVATVARTSRMSDPQRVSGRPVVTEPGRVGIVTRLELGAYQPGDYVLTFDARADRDSATRQVLFTVTGD